MAGIAVGEANKILDAFVGRGTYTKSAAVHAKLHTADPGAAGTTAAATSTARKLISWAAAALGVLASNAALTWSGSDLIATETITHLSFWTAGSGGTFLGSAALNTSSAVNAGETLNIASGSFTMTLTDSKLATGEKNKALDAWAGTTDYTASAALAVKLHIGDPGTAGANNPATETTRKAITFGTAASAGAIANTVAYSWTGLAASGTEVPSWLSFWSSVTHGAGTFLGRDDLATPRSIVAGDELDGAIGSLVFTVG